MSEGRHEVSVVGGRVAKGEMPFMELGAEPVLKEFFDGILDLPGRAARLVNEGLPNRPPAWIRALDDSDLPAMAPVALREWGRGKAAARGAALRRSGEVPA